MAWSKLAPLIVEILAKWVGPKIAEFFGKLLPQDGTAGVASAPDDLRQMIVQAILDAAAKLNRPLVYALAKALVPALTTLVIDAVWDQLFESGTVTTRAASFPPTTGAVVADNPVELVATAGLEALAEVQDRPAAAA